MKALRGQVRAILIVTAAAGFALFLASATQSRPLEPPQLEQAEYVGADLCQECHADQWQSYANSVHYASELAGEAPEGQAGCESCHGPGSTHVEMAGTEEPGFREAIISFKDEAAPTQAGQCLTCHAEMEAQQHFGTSEHYRVDVVCSDCHNPHQSLAVHAALRDEEPGLCYDCHGDKRGQFALPERHPVNEGFMTCTDCHNPHGTPNRTQLSRAGNDTCADCHIDKEGPFIFPHVAAEAEGCDICHEPHGSVTPHMLVKADISLVCYQCHQAPFGLAPPSFHREDSRGVCTECHVQIHGSNLDPKFMR